MKVAWIDDIVITKGGECRNLAEGWLSIRYTGLIRETGQAEPVSTTD